VIETFKMTNIFIYDVGDNGDYMSFELSEESPKVIRVCIWLVTW